MENILIKKLFNLTLITIIISVTFFPLVCGNDTINNNKKQYPDDTNYYAVIVACSRYENKIFNIPSKPFRPFPDYKLKCLYNSLLMYENWDENNIILLLNEQATKENIVSALENMSKIVTQNDIFLFSWQGHGSEVPEDPKNGPIDEEDHTDEVICPYDIYKDENQTLYNYITDDELNLNFDKINAKALCLIFDCCLSGGLNDIINTTSDENNKLYKSKFLQDFNTQTEKSQNNSKNNRVLIMSTSAGFIGKASFLTGFPLTKSISNGLKRKLSDKNKDGYISAEEVFSYAKPRAITQSLLIWGVTWTGCIIEHISEKHDNPVLRGTIDLILSYLLVQLIIYNKSNRFLSNNPCIFDDYDENINLVNIK